MDDEIDYSTLEISADEVYGKSADEALNTKSETKDDFVEDKDAEGKPDADKSADNENLEDDASDDGENLEDDASEEAEEGETEEEELARIEEKNKWMKGRLAPVKEKLTKAEQELAVLRDENAKLKAGTAQKPVAEVPAEARESIDAFVAYQVENHPDIKKLQDEIKDIIENADKHDNYIQKLTSAEAKLEVKKDLLAERVKAEVENYNSTIVAEEAKLQENFEASINALKEVHPKIDKAKARLDARVPDLHVEIRKAIVMNDNAGELVWKLGANPQNIEYLVEASKKATESGTLPIDALKFIGKLEARIEAEKSGNTETPSKPATQNKPAPAKKPVPKNLKSPQGGSSDDVGDLYEWANSAVKKGDRPW